MKMNSRALCVTAALLLCNPTFADCFTRGPTPAELEFKKRAEVTLRQALPPAPANWTMETNADNTYDGLCKGVQDGEFPVRVRATYTFARPKEDRDRRIAENRKIDKEIEN